jgi:hypothetical protein
LVGTARDHRAGVALETKGLHRQDRPIVARKALQNHGGRVGLRPGTPKPLVGGSIPSGPANAHGAECGRSFNADPHASTPVHAVATRNWGHLEPPSRGHIITAWMMRGSAVRRPRRRCWHDWGSRRAISRCSRSWDALTVCCRTKSPLDRDGGDRPSAALARLAAVASRRVHAIGAVLGLRHLP